MSSARSHTLLAVLANPPLEAGLRTLQRVDLAASLLGFRSFGVANLFALPTRATGAITQLGATESGWLAARPVIEAAVRTADGVLLAYGTGSPSGSARFYFSAQVDWLHDRLQESGAPVWQVGDGTRHPSRWQRWTCRAHPGVPFTEALRLSFESVLTDAVSPPH